MKRSRQRKLNYASITEAGGRLVLRPYRLGDFKELRRSFKERRPAIDKFDEAVVASKDTEIKSFKERLQRHRKIAKDGHHFVFGVFIKKSGEFVGQVDFFVINKQLRWANLGYNIHNQYRRKGYATEASKVGLKIAFQHLNFHRVEAATELSNKASQKVALNAGLLKEGKRKKFFPDDGGIDMVVFAQNAIDYT